MAENKFSMGQFESFLNLYLHDKLPGMPEGFKSFIVKVIPWLDLIMIIMVVPLALLALGLGTILGSLSFLPGAQKAVFVGGIISYILLFVPLVLQAIALPGLFKRTAMGWNFSFYAVLATAAGYIVDFNFGKLIGTAISLYILFQIRSYYSGLTPIAAVPVIPTANTPKAPPTPPAPQNPVPPPSAPIPPATPKV